MRTEHDMSHNALNSFMLIVLELVSVEVVSWFKLFFSMKMWAKTTEERERETETPYNHYSDSNFDINQGRQ